MRLSPFILATLLPVLGAAAQTPPPPSGFVGSEEQANPQPYVLSEEEARRRGLIDGNPDDDPPASKECAQALKQIDDERAASERVFQRGEDGPADLKEFYEQGLYYADKRAKAITQLCMDGQSRSHDFGLRLALQELSTNKKGCEIVAKDCKPRKHW